MQFCYQIRAAVPAEDALIAEHFYLMWLDNQIASSSIAPCWSEIVLQFMQQARQTQGYQAFVAEVAGRIVGSAGGQRFAGLCPNILSASERCDGYIWGVYVEPAYRNRGIATELTKQTIDHLKQIGCTHAVLNASPSGKPIYERLGFGAGNTMRLSLQHGG